MPMNSTYAREIEELIRAGKDPAKIDRLIEIATEIDKAESRGDSVRGSKLYRQYKQIKHGLNGGSDE